MHKEYIIFYSNLLNQLHHYQDRLQYSTVMEEHQVRANACGGNCIMTSVNCRFVASILCIRSSRLASLAEKIVVV